MPAPTGTPSVEVHALQEMLGRGADVTVLDIRPSEERADWFIPGSIHDDAYRKLRLGDPSALACVRLRAGAPVVVVCARGNTSQIGTRLLRARGVEAYSLIGGMKAWSLAWNTAPLAAPGVTLVQVRRTGKGCLAYLIASGGEAVVVDANLDPEVYLGLAQAAGARIRHVIDTHVHADHLSRSRALAERAGAPYWLPEQNRVHFPYEAVREGAELRFGSTSLRALHTPGHTLESMNCVVDGRWLLTGDTLFPAAVGRPDLAASPEEARARALLLHASLRRLFALDPELLVLGAHAGAPVGFDGAVIAATLGAAREAIRLPEDAEAFAAWVLGRIPPLPPNHLAIVAANEAGRLPPGDLTDLEAGANRCAVS